MVTTNKLYEVLAYNHAKELAKMVTNFSASFDWFLVFYLVDQKKLHQCIELTHFLP